MTATAMTPALEVLIESSEWQRVDLAALAERAYGATLHHLGLDSLPLNATLLATDSAEIARLNEAFRGKARPTNVLSWPTTDLSPDTAGHPPHPPHPDGFGEYELGDIALAWEVCWQEAQDAAKPLEAHLSHLVVHGVLHLLGYDHVVNEDAHLMEALEIEILGTLGVETPYKDG